MKRRKSLKERDRGALLLFLGHVGIGERKREKISWGSCDGGTRGQGRGRTGKSVRHDIFWTRQVGKSCGEFGKEGKMPLLARGKGSASLGNGCDERFVIGKQGEKTTFKEKTEVADSQVGGQQFTVKSGVSGLSRRKFVGEKGKGLPGTTGFLLQHCSDMGIGSIGG
jgi:hypothetical protein